MARLIAVVFVTVVSLASAAYLAFFTTNNPIWFAAALAVGAVAAYQSIALFRDRFVPDPQFKAQPRQPADEKMYLEGRPWELPRQVFNPEWQVELSGESIIQTRFDAYDVDFTAGGKPERIETFDDIAQAAEKFDQFVIVGDPGAGKSTSLRKLATDEARKYLKGESTLLPLWINLGFSENPVNAEDLLRYWWHERYNLPIDYQTYLNNNRLWLFLDGLNEMPESGGSRKERAQLLRTFLKQHPNVRAVVTCRVNDYVKPVSWARRASPLLLTEGEGKKDFDDGLNLDLPMVRVQPLDEGRIQEFIQRRLGQLTLWVEVQKNDALQRMASNPYNLAMLTEIYGSSGQLPADLNQLYSLYVRVRYDDYAARKLVRTSWRDLEKKLQRLAFRMIADGKGTAAKLVWVQQQVGRKALKDGVDLGIIVVDGDNTRFYHQSLHSYFALPDLKHRLQTNDFFDRRGSFIRQIGDLGEAAAPAIPALIEALHDQSADVRLSAAMALGNLGQAAAPAVPVLIKALRDPILHVRGGVGEALGKIGQAAAPAMPALIEALRDPAFSVRGGASIALGNIGQVAVPTLMEALHDPDADV